MALLAKSSVVGLKARTAAPVRRVAASRPRVVKVQASSQGFDRNWLKADPLVLGVGFLGWTVPSTIGVSAFGGESLFGLLTKSIGEELAHFPTGPALTDSFWLYLITWHIGLFVTLLLGQVGVNGRKQGYF